MKSILATIACLTIGVLILVPAQTMEAGYADIILAEPSLVSYWRMNETSTAQPADDLGPADNNGAYDAGIVLGNPSDFPENMGTLATFNNAADVRMLDTGADYLFANDFTVEAWVSRRFAPSFGDVVSTGNWYMGYAYYVDPGTGQIVYNGLRITNLRVRDYNFNVLLPYDALTHVVAMIDGNNDAILYLNGEFVKKVTHPSPGDPLPQYDDLRIGGNYNDSGHEWLGDIDEVAIYNSALDAATVRAHYLAGIPEPSSIVLLLLGSIAFAARARRRRGR